MQHPSRTDDAQARDLVGLPDFFTDGLLAETPVATTAGWIAVSHLRPGDRLLTFDGGPAEVVELRRTRTTPDAGEWPSDHWPLAVPPQPGVQGPGLRLLPDQLVLIDTDLAEAMFGDPFALVPSRALEGWAGIARSLPRAAEAAIVPVFEREQLIYAGGGTLVHCPGQVAPDLTGPAVYAPLSLAAARQLVACLMAEEVGAALVRATPGMDHAALG
ncbi:MAG: Hint domain-containing protein [Gemmobacter sp.]